MKRSRNGEQQQVAHAYQAGKPAAFWLSADIALVVEGSALPAHRQLLCCASSALCELLHSTELRDSAQAALPGGASTSLPCFELAQGACQLKTMLRVLDSVYHPGTFAVNSVAEAESLLGAAELLGLPDLEAPCDRFLAQQLAQGSHLPELGAGFGRAGGACDLQAVHGQVLEELGKLAALVQRHRLPRLCNELAAYWSRNVCLLALPGAMAALTRLPQSVLGCVVWHLFKLGTANADCSLFNRQYATNRPGATSDASLTRAESAPAQP